MTRRRIAVLLHRNQSERHLRHYLIKHLADIWRGDGEEVVFLSGPDRVVPADVLVVHVDLSVVPDEYLEFATQYPIALNAAVRDIRKRAFSQLRVNEADGYGGRVIVKSNLNYGGDPERALGGPGIASRLRAGFGATRPGKWLVRRLRPAPGYALYEVAAQVPAHVFTDETLIVERFVPETENGRFYVRYFDFLGDRFTCLRTESADPVIRGDNVIRTEEIEPHPALFEWRRRLKLDYGKLDYVVHDGEIAILDVNKTSGAGALPLQAEVQSARRRHWAEGIYGYLQ